MASDYVPPPNSGVVRQRPMGKSYSALDLERERLADVHANMDRLDPKDREEFVTCLKTIKVFSARVPHIKVQLGRYVGEHNTEDAFKKLQQEADAELSREAAIAALEKTAPASSRGIESRNATQPSGNAKARGGK